MNRLAVIAVISATEVYGRDEFMARTQLGDWAFRQAKRNGLRTFKVGTRVFIAGQDWLEFLTTKAEATDA